VTDAQGRQLARASSAEGAPAVAEVPTGPGDTLYVRIGDAFGWLCAACAALLLGWSLQRPRI
jgi:apolipoprotein N-acyltransferase